MGRGRNLEPLAPFLGAPLLVAEGFRGAGALRDVRLATRGLGFELANGQQVLVRARASLYEARGEYQLIVDYVEEAGEGVLRRKFEELKRRLAAEGLFEAARKRAIPKMPRRIGVVTSPTGAALRDVLIALRRRFPLTAVLIYPTPVQGPGSAEEIARTLALADRRAECDVLILTRGGGSLEDLWSFNEEIVARAIAAVELPIISGVGHEIDFTIADFVADLRAPTPSQAADSPSRISASGSSDSRTSSSRSPIARGNALRPSGGISRCSRTAYSGVTRACSYASARSDRTSSRRGFAALSSGASRRASSGSRAWRRPWRTRARARLTRARERWRTAHGDLRRTLLRHVERTQQRLKLASRALTSLSPLATLERGYAIVTDAGGKVLTDSGAVTRGAAIDVRLARGGLAASVDAIKPHKS